MQSDKPGTPRTQMHTNEYKYVFLPFEHFTEMLRQKTPQQPYLGVVTLTRT
jgi:hypothetical protein